MKNEISLKQPSSAKQNIYPVNGIKADTSFTRRTEIRFKKDFKEINLAKDILLPSIGIPALLTVIGLFVAVKTLRSSYKLARVNFEFQLIQSHRDVWSKIHSLKTGEELVSPTATLRNLTEKEVRYLVFLVLNTKIGYEARKNGILQPQKSVMRDIGDFYSRPLLNKLWNDIKLSYEGHFVAYIDKCISLANEQPANEKPALSLLKRIVSATRSAVQAVKFKKKPTNQSSNDPEDVT